MPILSNIDEVGRWLDSVVTTFDFECPGINGSLKEDCAHAVAEGIQERSYERQASATAGWPENSPEYKQYKLSHYGTDKTNYRTRQMLSESSLTANVSTTDSGKTVVMKYGTGEAPTSSYNGYIEDSDKEITDTEKAAYAHASGREFYQVDQDLDNEKVMPILECGLGKHLQEAANE